MQSIGASEKVFRLIELSPSDQFTAEGMHFLYLIFTDANIYTFMLRHECSYKYRLKVTKVDRTS